MSHIFVLPFYLVYSEQKLPENPAPHQTQCQDASHTDGWTSLNTRKAGFYLEEKADCGTSGWRGLLRRYTWVSWGASVAFWSPAAAKMATALGVRHHQTLKRPAADEVLVHLLETHVLVSCSTICVAEEKEDRHKNLKQIIYII